MKDTIDTAIGQIATPYQSMTDNLGASKISTFLYCPRQYYYQYVAKLPRSSPPAATLGTCVHAVIQHAHKAKWSDSDAGSAKRLLDEMWLEAKPFVSDPDDPQVTMDVVAAGEEWLPWYLWWIREQVDVAVEERWEFPAGDGIILTGTIDRIYREGGRLLLSDVKSGKRTLSPVDLSNDLQLSVYAWAASQMELTLDGLEHVLVRKKKTLQTHRSPAYIKEVMQSTVIPVANAIAVAEATDIWICNTASKWGCGFCSYKDSCPVGSGSTTEEGE